MRPGLVRAAIVGVGRAGRVRAALLLWGLGLVAAAPTAVAVGASVHDFFGPRPAGDTFAAGLDPVHLVSFGANGDLSGIRPAALVSLGLWFLLAPVGHAVALTAAGLGRRAARDLLGRAGATYPRLLAVQLVGLALLGIVTVPAGLAARHLGGAAVEGWTSEQGVLALQLGLGAGVLALAALVKGATDAARVRVVVDDAGALGGLAGGLGAGFRRPALSLGLVAVFGGAAAALTGVTSWLDAGLVRDAPLAVVAGLLLQQGTALVRNLLRLGLAGAQTFGFATSARQATIPARE